jgi:hypothetical protein
VIEYLYGSGVEREYKNIAGVMNDSGSSGAPMI